MKKLIIMLSVLFFLLSTSVIASGVSVYANPPEETQIIEGEDSINVNQAVRGVNTLNKLFTEIISSVGVIFAILGVGKYALAFTSDNVHEISKAIALVVVGSILANINLLITV